MKLFFLLALMAFVSGCVSTTTKTNNSQEELSSSARDNNDTPLLIKRKIAINYGDGRNGTVVLREKDIEGESMSVSHKCGVTTPEYLPVPSYPAALSKKREEGIVKLIITFDVNGKVSSIKVEESSHDYFTYASIDAVKHWKYHPLICNGKAVEFTIGQVFPFVINR